MRFDGVTSVIRWPEHPQKVQPRTLLLAMHQMTTMRRAILFCCLISPLGASQATAQTYTWNGGGGSGSWANSSNWTGGLPASSATTIIQLDGTTQTTTTQNIAGAFQLNQLLALADATTGFVVGGNTLQFAGTSAFIETGSTALLRINAPIDFSVNTLLNPTANNASGAEIRLSGPLTATAGTTVTVGSVSSPPGTMVVIDGTSVGFAGTWAVTNSTITQATGINFISRSADVVTSGPLSVFTVGTTTVSGLSDIGASVQMRALSGTGQFQVGTTLTRFNGRSWVRQRQLLDHGHRNSGRGKRGITFGQSGNRNSYSLGCPSVVCRLSFGPRRSPITVR